MENFPYLNEALTKVIIRLRKNAGLSQKRLAEHASMARVYLLQLEQGKFRPTLNALFYLSRGLGISPEKLVGEVEEERQKMESAAMSQD